MRHALTATLLIACGSASAQSAAPPAPSTTLFRDVRVFDGRQSSLTAPRDVLVRGATIARIAPAGSVAPEGTVVEGGGRTLMPGLIDAHWHAMMATVPLAVALNGDIGYLNLLAARGAGETLLRGFTSVRDLAGPTFALKRAIDEGVTPGPRIWPSGAMISQTSGHGDYRMHHELPRAPGTALSYPERTGGSAIADGPDEVRRRVREQLMQGASQIKLAAGGGVSSNYDPLDVSQYTEAEFRVAVEDAENWGTYVTVHAYTPRAVRTAIRAGVKVIDHGQLIDEPTAKLMADNGTWLSLQPFLDDEDATPFPEASDNRAKQLQMVKGTDTAYALAKKHKLKLAWGTDTLFDARLAKRQGVQLTKMLRWFTPVEILRMATSGNAELLALSGLRSPYKGRLGVVEEGALADLLLVDGDPIANLRLVEDPDRNFVVIMKDGRVHKNSLRP
jgi:imidazolonepropionase-like amidohydrolase